MDDGCLDLLVRDLNNSNVKKDDIKMEEKEVKPVYCIDCKYSDVFNMKLSFSNYILKLTIEIRALCGNYNISNNYNERLLPIKRLPRYASCYSMNVCNQCKFFKKTSIFKKIIRTLCMKYYEHKIKN